MKRKQANKRITPVKIVSLATLGVLLSCSSPTNNEQAESKTTDSVPEVVDTVTNQKDEDCIRAQAEPVIKKSVYPTATFKLNTDNRTGTETVDLKNGDRLTISNWGCEYYVLTFKFQTTRFQADTTDTNYWIDKGLQLMREIEGGLDSPLDIHGGEVALKNYLTETKAYKLGEGVDYGNETIPNTVTVDRIQKLSDKKFGIELTYSIGPL